MLAGRSRSRKQRRLPEVQIGRSSSSPSPQRKFLRPELPTTCDDTRLQVVAAAAALNMCAKLHGTPMERLDPQGTLSLLGQSFGVP